MASIEKKEVEEMRFVQPDYAIWARKLKITIEEWVLLIYGIDPHKYNTNQLKKGFMFIKMKNGFLEPDCYVPEAVFQKVMNDAYETYDTLKRVDWSIKYGQNQCILYDYPTEWLFIETREMGIKISEEFLKIFEKTYQSQCMLGTQQERQKKFNDIIEKIVTKCDESGIKIDRKKMPGTKSEWFNLMLKIDQSLRCIGDGTMPDYFDRSGYRFKRGSRKDSAEMKNVIGLFFVIQI